MKTLTSIFISCLIIISGCNLQDDPLEDFQPIEVSEKAAQLIHAENQFGFELFKNVYSAETEHENIMVSPLSVSIALAMTYNGARGETKTAMEKTLKVYGLTPEEINESYFSLMNALKSLDRKVLLEIANAIYYREDFMVERDFISTNEYYYKAIVSPLDFNNSIQALATINGWVNEKTHGKIESIIDQITGDHVMFLLNAIYFKGIWKTEFKEEDTKPFPFITGKGETIEVQGMRQVNSVPYTSNDLFSAVELPYGKGNYNMYVFLPKPDHELSDMIDNLNDNNWNNWIHSLSPVGNVEITFPKFKYEYESTLNDVLTEMGMGVAFTGSADFTGINKGGGLKIDFVKHKTFVEVNEEGTEAAAVTVVGIVFTSAGPDNNIPFYVDRPFLYAITEKSTGAILFMGTVKNPLLN